MIGYNDAKLPLLFSFLKTDDRKRKLVVAQQIKRKRESNLIIQNEIMQQSILNFIQEFD